MALLPPVALDLGDRHAMHANAGQRLAHLVELEGFDDGNNELHGRPSLWSRNMGGRFIGVPKSGSFLCKWHKKVATSNGNPVLFIRASVLIESEPRLFPFVLTRFLARTGIHFARKRY